MFYLVHQMLVEQLSCRNHYHHHLLSSIRRRDHTKQESIVKDAGGQFVLAPTQSVGACEKSRGHLQWQGLDCRIGSHNRKLVPRRVLLVYS
jgi:hypothetical protein